MNYLHNTPYSSRSLYLDSKNSIKRGSNYIFNLETIIQAPVKTRMCVQVKECQLMNTFPNIRTGINDRIFIAGTITGLKEYVIPQDYYSIVDFKTLFNNLSITLGQDIVLTYSMSSLRVTFSSATEDFTIEPETTVDVLGLGENRTSETGTLKMNFMMDFSGLDYVFFKSNITLKNINNLGETTNTLLRLPIVQPYGYSIYHDTNLTTHLTHEKSINNIHIQVTDKEGRDLELNNTNFQVTLQISFIYPSEEREYINTRAVHDFEKS